MMSSGTIQYLRRIELDIAKWNACIDASANGLVYARSDYLDHLAQNWDALVMGDYEAVMPMPWKKKWGFRYLYQPPFTQQLGIISPAILPPQMIVQFLEMAKQHFRFAEIFLNYGNVHSQLSPRNNYILPLSDSYAGISKRYKNGLPGRVRAVEKRGLIYRPLPGPETAISLYRKEYEQRIPHVTAGDYDLFLRVCNHLQKSAGLVLRGVCAPQGAWLSVALLLLCKDRLYLLISATPRAGRNVFANHFLLDRLICEFAGSGLTIDFEGSDIPGIAHFYRSFGSINQPYYFHRHNLLPWWCRWLKE